MPKQGVRIHIQKLINEAPPLTEDKRHRLQTIFHPATARGFVVITDGIPGNSNRTNN